MMYVYERYLIGTHIVMSIFSAHSLQQYYLNILQVHNTTINELMNSDEHLVMRRTMSQPGPISGGLVTATAARAARKRAIRTVNYASDFERKVSNFVYRFHVVFFKSHPAHDYLECLVGEGSLFLF